MLSLSSPWMGDRPYGFRNCTNHLLVPLGKKLNSSFPTPLDESINRGLVWVHMHKIILSLKRSWHWCPGVDISAGYRYIPSMHLPKVGARLPLRREYNRPCTQKSTPLGVLAGVNSLWCKQTNTNKHRFKVWFLIMATCDIRCYTWIFSEILFLV